MTESATIRHTETGTFDRDILFDREHCNVACPASHKEFWHVGNDRFCCLGHADGHGGDMLLRDTLGRDLRSTVCLSVVEGLHSIQCAYGEMRALWPHEIVGDNPVATESSAPGDTADPVDDFGMGVDIQGDEVISVADRILDAFDVAANIQSDKVIRMARRIRDELCEERPAPDESAEQLAPVSEG